VISVAAVFALTSLGGMFSLGQAAYLCIGAYSTFMLMQYAGMSLLVAGGISILLGGVLAGVVGLLTLKLRRDYFALMSVGLGQAIPALIVVFKDYTRGSMGYTQIPKVNPLLLLFLSAGIMVLILFCIRNYKYSRFGRMNLAQKNDEMAAKSFGINVYQLKIKTYMLASAIGCLAGILYALRSRYIDNMFFSWSLSAEMMIFLFFGGTNSLTGSAISAFILKLLPSLLRDVNIFGNSMESYRTIIYCVLIIIFLNFRTSGLMGEMELSLGCVLRERPSKSISRSRSGKRGKAANE